MKDKIDDKISGLRMEDLYVKCIRPEITMDLQQELFSYFRDYLLILAPRGLCYG